MKPVTKHVVWSVVGTLLVLAAIPPILIVTGAVNLAATNAPGAVEKWIATWTVSRSVNVRAPSGENPIAEDAAAIETGLQHFRAMCLQCHGAPGMEPEGFAKGLNPPAPELSKAVDEWSDSELFWIVKHGIRMTGMPAFGPTHEERDIWKMVAFLRALPDLTDQQREKLRESSAEGHSHGHGGHETTDAEQLNQESDPHAETAHEQHSQHDH